MLLSYIPLLRARLAAFVLLATVAGLVGCSAKIPFQGDRSKERIAHDLGVPAESILRQDRCVIERYDGNRVAPGFECIYIATASYAAVLDFDKTSGRFKEALRISKETDAIVFVSKITVLLLPLAQIQVLHGQQRYCIEFVNSDLGQIGHQQDLHEAYDQLRSIGVVETDGLPYVARRAPPMRIMVTVHVGR
jgi:hypothetical protein